MSGAGFVILMLLIFVVFYVLMVRPQRQRQAEHQSMIDRLDVGEDVLTTGGIYGTVIEAEGDDLVVEVADGVTVHMTRRGIAAVLPPEPEDEEEEGADEPDFETEEEPVTADYDEDRSAGSRR